MSASDAYVEIRCPACKAPEQVPADATELNCPDCGAHHRFLLCPVCHETAQVDDKVGRRGGTWRCPSCRSAIPVPRLGRPKAGSADAVHRQLEAKGTLKHDPDNRVHGGFVVVGVKGAYGLPARAVCMVSTLADEVRVVVAGPGAIVKIPYDRLTGVQIVGEDKTAGRFFNDRFGVAGAAGDIRYGHAHEPESQEARDHNLPSSGQPGRRVASISRPDAAGRDAPVVPSAGLPLPAGMTNRIACRAVFLDAGGVIVLPDRHLLAGALARVGIDIDPSAVPHAHYRAVRALDHAVRVLDRAPGRSDYPGALVPQLRIVPGRRAEAIAVWERLADRARSS